jgi:hypothetical protein
MNEFSLRNMMRKLSVIAMILSGPLISASLALADQATINMSSARESTVQGKGAEDPKAAFEQHTLEVKANVELWETRLARRLAAVNEMARTMDLRKLEPQRTAVEQLREVLSDMDDEAATLLKLYSELGPEVKLYRGALQQAPVVFTKLADSLEAKAGEKRDQVLVAAYADLSAQARSLASGFIQRAKETEGLEKEISQRVEFVRQSREFLHDASVLLASIPATSEAIRVEALVRRLNSYVDAFQHMLDTLRNVSDKIGAPNSARGAKQAAAAPAANTGVAVFTEYRRRLADLHN